MNTRFLEAKTEAHLVFELSDDFRAALKVLPVVRQKYRILRLIEEAIKRDVTFIASHPPALFQTLWNTCWWYDCPEAEKHYETLPGFGWPICICPPEAPANLALKRCRLPWLTPTPRGGSALKLPWD